MIRAPLIIAAAAVLQIGGLPLHAQDVRPEAPRPAPRAPRIGVVLSGGGAKGIAHIGVLRILESEGIFADVVAGTSMGALVGGLYAIGYTPTALDSLVTSLDWVSYFLDAPEPRFLSLDRRFIGDRTILELPLKNWRVRLPTGVISGQRISELLARLTWTVQAVPDFRRFPRPFVAIGTDIESGETVVLDSGSLAHALRASISIPGLFDPVPMNGRLVVDGGITRNLPARDARALGADILICSDVADPFFAASRLKSLVDVLLQTMTIYVEASSEPERRLCDVVIRPSADGLDPADFDAAAEWIARGVKAATAARRQLNDIAARVPGPPRASVPRSTTGGRPAQHPVTIAGVVIEGVSGDAARSVRQRLRIRTGARVTSQQVDAAVKRVYATELFDDVRYRLHARGADTIIVVTADAREEDDVGVGVRYDDTYNASLLFSIRLRNRIGFGSRTQLDLRLGEQLRAAAEHVNVGIAGSRLAAGVAAGYSRTPVLLYEGDRQADDGRVQVASVSAFTALLLGDDIAAGVEVKNERSDSRTTIAGVTDVQRRTFASGAVFVRSNTLDRATFPTRGHLLSLRSERTLGRASNAFTQHVAHAQIALPLSRSLAAHARATFGSSSPEAALPLHYLFMLGGAYPSQLFPETQIAFAGLRPQERVGAAVSRLGVALQWEASQNVFATLRADAGYVGRTLTLNADAYTLGVGFALGALTPVGPVELSGGVRPRGGRPRLELSLGYPF